MFLLFTRAPTYRQDVVVGDICLVEPGEILPVDGLFLRGHNVRCDESAATGESDALRKAAFEICWAEHNAILEARARGENPGELKKDPFLISGSKVMEGVGAYVVVAVGERSFNGRIMMGPCISSSCSYQIGPNPSVERTGLRDETPATPLQLKLNALAELIAKIGSLAGLLLFLSLMIRFFVQLGTEPNRTANQKAMSFVQILIISVTLIVVAVPEGARCYIIVHAVLSLIIPLEFRLTARRHPCLGVCYETDDTRQSPCSSPWLM